VHLGRRQFSAGLVGVALETPRADRLAVKQVENIPSQLVVVNEGHEGLTSDRIQELNIEGIKFFQRRGVFFLGLEQVAFEFFDVDEHSTIRSAWPILDGGKFSSKALHM
jgi:hypothetical protein